MRLLIDTDAKTIEVIGTVDVTALGDYLHKIGINQTYTIISGLINHGAYILDASLSPLKLYIMCQSMNGLHFCNPLARSLNEGRGR
ncbi:hypothetical protein [Emticicia fontis]